MRRQSCIWVRERAGNKKVKHWECFSGWRSLDIYGRPSARRKKIYSSSIHQAPLLVTPLVAACSSSYPSVFISFKPSSSFSSSVRS